MARLIARKTAKSKWQKSISVSHSPLLFEIHFLSAAFGKPNRPKFLKPVLNVFG